MSETKHTPGPWRADTTLKGWAVIGPMQKIVVLATDRNTRKTGARLDNENKANCERIASCFNACEGIFPEAIPSIIHALKNMIEVTKNFSWPAGVDKKSFLSAALDAIAKVEGKS